MNNWWINVYYMSLQRSTCIWLVAMDMNEWRSLFKETGQEDNKLQTLLTPTSDGLKTIHIRLKLRNYYFRSDRLTGGLAACPSPSIICHNGCRASYTSYSKFEILKAADISLDQVQSSSLALTTLAQPQKVTGTNVNRSFWNSIPGKTKKSLCKSDQNWRN